MRIFSGLIVIAAALAVSRAAGGRHAAAQQPAPAASAAAVGCPDDAGDPYENTNRAIFGFNQGVDRTVLVPVANAYRAVIPSTFRDMIHDFLQNLDSPIIFANDVLQGQPGLASETLAGRCSTRRSALAALSTSPPNSASRTTPTISASRWRPGASPPGPI